VYLLDAQSGETLAAWSIPGSEMAIFAPDLHGAYYSVAGIVGRGNLDLHRINLVSGTKAPVFAARGPCLDQVAFTPNGHILAVSGWHPSENRTYVHRIDVWSATALESIETHAQCLAYSPDGQVLATGNRGRSVCVWRGKSFEKQWTEPAAALAWSPTGRLAWGMKECLAIVSPGSEEAPRTWSGTSGELTTMTFSPDGRFLWAGTARGACAVHDTVLARESHAFDWGIGAVHSIAFSPDGLVGAAGGENGQIVVWDVDV
jgi:WD40 repeat protein